MAVAPTGSNASHMPMEGMAFSSVGVPVSFSAWVTTVNVRLPRTGNANQSVCPTWLMRPAHIPLTGIMRGEASVPIASSYPPIAESGIFTVRVCVFPADNAVTEMGCNVPEGATCPSKYGPTESVRM